MQTIYQGQSVRSVNHWTNEEKAIKLIEKFLLQKSSIFV